MLTYLATFMKKLETKRSSTYVFIMNHHCPYAVRLLNIKRIELEVIEFMVHESLHLTRLVSCPGYVSIVSML